MASSSIPKHQQSIFEYTGGHCYFICLPSFDFIKIGTTSNIIQRMKHWRGYWLLGVVEGYYDREAELHQQFGFVTHGSEHFEPTDELIEFILRETHQDVPAECWEYVHKFPRDIFDDLLTQDDAQYRLLGEGS